VTPNKIGASDRVGNGKERETHKENHLQHTDRERGGAGEREIDIEREREGPTTESEIKGAILSFVGFECLVP
jgi:hypothetical protein